ncbi:hypothetical protein V1525DRAFT_440534, partial [Lipomyces kononenkoae]
GASWKYQRDKLKIIKACQNGQGLQGPLEWLHSHYPDKEEDYTHFLGWTRTLVRHNVSFETTVYEEYEKATQRNNQSPVDFDAYLSSIERELPEVPDSVQANRFYAKLTDDVVNQIKTSGLQNLPDIRTGTVELAQRVWEGLRIKRSISNSATKSTVPSASSRQGQQSYQKNKLYYGHQEQPGSKNMNKTSDDKDSKNRKGFESDNHKEKSATTDKQAITCYSCGGAGHVQRNCPQKDEKTKSKFKPRVQRQKVVEPMPTSSEEESSETSRGALGPEDEPPIRIGPHLQTKGFVRRLNQVHEIYVDLYTGAEVSCVSHEWAQKHELKPTRRSPETLGGK